MWGGNLHRHTAAAAAPSGARAATTPTALSAAKHGKSAATPQEQPPPPPTVAPPPPGVRKPKERSAFRQRRKSDSQRQEEQVAMVAAQSAAGAGRQVFLDQTALAQRAAAVAASRPRANNQQQQQQQQQQAPHVWRDAVLAPLLELLPELRTALRRSARAARGHIPRVLVLDAFNLLHVHPSTKSMLHDGLLHQARTLLQAIVKDYAAEQHVYVVLAYDAVNLRVPQLLPGARRQRSSSSGSSGISSSGISSGSGSSSGSGTFTAASSSSGATRRVSVLSGRVSAVYEAGTEADTVIIHLVQELLDREAAAAAAGQLGPASGGPLVRVAVHTNDQRIQAACSEASMAAGARLVHHALSVACHSQGALSNALARVEQRRHPSLACNLYLGPTQAPAWARAQASAGAPGTSDPRTDTVAWAESLLAPGRAASRRRQEEQDEQQQQQVSGRRRRRQRQAAAEQEVQLQQQQVLAAGLDDEQLLQAAASTGPETRGLAAAGADTTAATSPPVASSSSSSAVLDELLSLDLGSL